MEQRAVGVRPATLNRRRFLALTGSVAAGAILAACGGSTATDTPKPAAPATSATTTATSPAATDGAPAASASATTVGTTAAGSASAVSGTLPAASTTSGATTTGTTAASGTGVSGMRPAGSAVTTGSAPSGTTIASGSASAGTSGQTLVIEASEYAFKTLGSIPAGVTTVQMKNLGKEDHEAQFVRLNDGITPEQFIAAIRAGGR